MPNILRIQRSRLVHVARSLDDRPPIRKHSELEPIRTEFEQKPVIAHFTHHSEMMGKLFEVQPGRAAVRHLDGVASAQTGRVRAVFAGQPFEAALLAARTIDLAQQR